MHHIQEDVQGFIGRLFGEGSQVGGDIAPQVEEAPLLLRPTQDPIQDKAIVGGAITDQDEDLPASPTNEAPGGMGRQSLAPFRCASD